MQNNFRRKVNSVHLFFRLIEFLLGETDGTPREPRHLFRLYMAKRQFTEAAKTAVSFP